MDCGTEGFNMKKNFKVCITGYVEQSTNPQTEIHDWIGSSPFIWKKADVEVKHIQKSPSLKGGNFERDYCRNLSNWVSGGLDKDIYWRTSGSGGWATRKGSQMQVGDITCYPEKVHIGGWLTDLVVVELRNRQLEIGDLFSVIFEWYQDTLQKCVAVGLKKVPILIEKSKGVLFTMTPAPMIDSLGIDHFDYKGFAFYDFRHVFNLPPASVAEVWRRYVHGF